MVDSILSIEEANEVAEEIDKLKRALEDAEAEEQDAASRVASFTDELSDLQNLLADWNESIPEDDKGY